MAQALDSRPRNVDEFKSWMSQVGIRWDAEVLRLEAASSNVSVTTERELSDGDTICVIPKSSVISMVNSELFDVLEEERVGGGLGLTMAVMHEMARGACSRWCAPCAMHTAPRAAAIKTRLLERVQNTGTKR